MKSITTNPACGEADAPLFDNWFDPIEAGLRAKVRGFIEALIEEELTAVLARPRYRRRQPDTGGGAAAPVIGMAIAGASSPAPSGRR